MTVQPQATNTARSAVGGHEPANLGDILERVLDRGLVIVGDIRVSLLDIELLTVKLRLLIASVDTARELGIDWWRHDPWLSGSADGPGAPDRDGRPAVRSRDRAAAVEGEAAARRELPAEKEPLRARAAPRGRQHER